MTTVSRFEFDVELLARNVLARKATAGLTWAGVESETGVPRAMLTKYFVVAPRKPDARYVRHRVSMSTALKLLMWVGDHDIRDYCLEER